jgi:flagellar hook-associated protein FlgK
MTAVSAIAVSGLEAAQAALSVAGHNIANAATPAFRRQVAVQQAVPEGGTAVRIERAAIEGDDLASDVVGLMEAKHGFFANLAVFKTADAMTGSLLDAVG